MNPLSRSLLLFMTDVTIRATVLLALTAIVAALSRRASASFRHLVWALGLGCTLFLPLLTLALPSWKIAVRTSANQPQPTPLAPQIKESSPAPLEAVVPPMASPRHDPTAVVADHFATAHPTPAPLPSAVAPLPPFAWAPWIILLWTSGVILVLAQLAQGLAAVRRIERESVPLTDGLAVGALAEARTQMKIGRPVALRQASPGRVTVPLTYGAFQPVIVLPAEAAQWPQERLWAALLHEAAHVRRGDWPLHLLTHVARAVYWFHPLAWLFARRARAESEAAADDLVLAAGVPAQDYARQLLDVALCARRQGRLGAGAVAMAQTPRIEGRLRLILSLGRSRGEIGGRARAATLAVAACVLVVGSVVHVASRAAGTDRVVSADASDPQVTLPNGATVCLLGVKDSQAGPGGWWKPDGTPLTAPLPKSTLIFPSLAPGERGRTFAVETRYPMDAQPRLTWAGRPNFGWAYALAPGGRSRYHAKPNFGWADAPAPGGHPLYYAKPNFTWGFAPDDHMFSLNHFQQSETGTAGVRSLLVQTALMVRPSDRTRTVKWAVAAGPWTQTVSCPKKTGKTRIKTPSGDVIFTLIPNPHALTDPKAVAHGNAVFMESDDFGITPSGELGSYYRGTDFDRDILALDRTGRVLYDLRGGVTPEASGRLENAANIPNSVLRRVASFRLLARPFQWAEFKRVQLQPQTSVASTPLPATSQGQPDTAAAHVARGEYLQQQGQPRDGIPEFRRAVQIDPNDAEAQYRLASGLYSIKDQRVGTTTYAHDAPPAILDEAIQHLKKAVALRPDDPDWPSLLGTYLGNRGRYAEAITFYKRSLHLLGPVRYMSVLHRITADGSGKAGEVFDNQWSLGDALLKTGHYREAAVHYQEALRFNPRADWVLLGYGDALQGAGRRPEAQAAWKKVLAIQPPNPYYQHQARVKLTQARLTQQ